LRAFVISLTLKQSVFGNLESLNLQEVLHALKA